MINKRLLSRVVAIVFTFALLIASLVFPFSVTNERKVFADVNKVYFAAETFEANDAGLIFAKIVVEGTAGQVVTVAYHTEGETAIGGVDYKDVANTIRITIGVDGTARYTVSIASLGGYDERQKANVRANNEIFGRYFSLVIDKALNANITMGICKCYLPYDNIVDGTVGIKQNGSEIGYINDYKTMQSIYHGGKGNIDGKSTWKTWKNGVSFDNDTTRRWLNAYVNTGLASAYSSYLIKQIGNAKYYSSTDIYVLAGNDLLRESYSEVKHGVPGCYLYLGFEPRWSFWSGFYAEKINGRAMYLIANGKNPMDEDDDYIDVNSADVSPNNRHVYWIQDKDAWYAKKDALADSVFYKTDPYNGKIDMSMLIWNKNKEVDIQFDKAWFLMTLIDETCPTVVGQYLDDSRMAIDGKLRFCIRFSEPVVSTQKKSIEVKFNNSKTPYYANYVDGNYTDTLVYELDPPKITINSATYQLPNDDIGDLAYNLDAYKVIRNNKVQNTDKTRMFTMINGSINNVKPCLAIDKESNTAYKNNYNLILSLNDNGNVDITRGTIYYEWSKEETKSAKTDPISYKYSRMLDDVDSGSINVTLVKNESEGIDSGTYYLHALAVGRYGLTDTATYGPYVLDGDPPVITQEPLPLNELKTKTFMFTNGKKGGAEIVNVNINAKVSDENDAVSHTYSLMTDGVPIKGFTRTEDGVFTYRSNINDVDADGDGLPDEALDEFILSLMKDDSRMTVSIWFDVEDSAGNIAETNKVTVIYDKRDTFKVTTYFPSENGYEQITDIQSVYPAYDISSAVRGDGIGIAVSVGKTDRTQIVEGTKFRVFAGDKEYSASEEDPYTVVIGDLTPGYYQLIPNIYGNVDDMTVDLAANPIQFYLSDGMDDLTTNNLNSRGNLVLSGSVFRIDDARFYYIEGDDTVMSHLYGATYNDDQMKYEGGSAYPAFSNVNQAKKYVRYMEYLDMYVVRLTANQASMLNSSAATTIYTKASGEMRTAQEGQLWIRYKKKSWTTSSNANGWAYYFYGDGGSSDMRIDLSRLSENLIDSVNLVVNRIVSVGKTVDLVTEADLDVRSGGPYLSSSQIHVQPETASTTKNGSVFVNAAVYEGDTSIYQSTVEVNGKNYPLATNMRLSIGDGTTLYYRYYESLVWRPITANDGQLLSSVLAGNASGIYTIREYEENGVSEFDVYFDKTTPTLTMTLNGERYVLDGTVVNYSGNTAFLEGMSEEVDPYGYVAIYTYPNRSLRKVLRRDDVANYDLGTGNYYLQVGDRSGNIITYTVLLSTTMLEVKVEESEAQTGIRVRVLNREEDEIYSYEVYLNEELITSEYSSTKLFKDPGVYRIMVVDIFGNTITEVYEYNSYSPKITWFYLNDRGGYSKYDPSNVVNMIIKKDETNPRLSTIFTSSRVRLTFDLEYGDSAIKFEMTGLEQGAYTYSDATGVMTINTDDSWRLRVWFEDYPQNDRTYVCIIDKGAPEYDATFVGTNYSNNISFDSADFLAGYNEGDVIALEHIEIVEGDLATLSFDDGSVISGSHIAISLFDPAGIRSYTVTRNGQPVSLSLNDDGQLLINNYGSYVVTATDNLGNVSSFRFANVKETISTATVDGREISEDKAYGNNNVVVTAQYASSVTMIVNCEDGNNTYVFDNDDGLLTCGQYVLRIDNDAESNERYVEIDEDNAIRFYIEEVTTVGKWYDVIRHTDFTISVMLDDLNRVNYKITAADKLLETQIYVTVGENKRPCLYTVDLSTNEPKVQLLTNGQPAEIIEGLNYIYIAGVLTIGEVGGDVTNIKAGYSVKPETPTLTTIYEYGVFTVDFEGVEDGYYTLVVSNIYYTETVYKIQKIHSFSSLVTVTYLDGMKREYVTNPPVISSNYKIDLTVYSTSVYFEVNDVVYDGYVVGGMTNLQLDRPGEYDVKIIASNGVFERFLFEIATDQSFVLSEDWLTGYNERALLKEQGYTNDCLTVNIGDGVEYVDVVCDGETEILYDNVSENKITDKSLENAVGRSFKGTYVVNFRNKYGDLATKTVHISMTPQLVLTRKTIVRPNEWEKIDSDKSLTGVYSNYIIRFSTESTNYEFRINDNPVSLDEPQTIELDRSSGNGSFRYNVYFLDEYGNALSFEAVLLRTDIEVDASAMREIEIAGKTYTKDNVLLNFREEYTATVSIDGEEPISYVSGTHLYRDGEYAFTITDIAGNRLDYTINHKSINHYKLTDTATGQPIIGGGVVNNSSVMFEALDDSVVKTAVRNGALVDSGNMKTFSLTGHWELLITDPLGNASYAEFYVINNSLGSFDYSAPYNFEITEVWMTDRRGNVSHMDFDKKTISLVENGDYVVGVTGIGILSSFRFTVTIDNTPPSITLVGVENNGITANDVSFKGLKSTDNVKIYKDGVLIEDTDVSEVAALPEITTGGDYRIVVTNIQGVSTEYTFTRKKIANAATSIFIIIVVSMLAIGIIIGLLYHSKQRTDA